MRYQIVTTLGPASATETGWEALLASGASAFRLNTSHLSLQQAAEWLGRLQIFRMAFQSRQGVWFPVILDLQGSKWRLGEFEARQLVAGQTAILVPGERTAHPEEIPVPHTDFFQAASLSSGEIVLNDARVRLQVEQIENGSIQARVTQGGEVAPRKGITFPNSTYRKESLSTRDEEMRRLAEGLEFVRFALSYVRDGLEMRAYRQIFGAEAYLIAKIERGPAVEDVINIVGSADELWLARGDLGAELGLSAMAEAVFHFSALPRQLPVPVLMAGQVLEHMKEHPYPTRSEICDLYASLQQGYAGVVLSDETAIGQYPVESSRTAAMFL